MAAPRRLCADRPGTDLTGALDQANYCIWCHNQGKDSCSKGLKEKDGAFKKSVFGVTLAGCPLEEKISEMNLVKARGNSLGALAIVAVDNPICAATGHRICNDCMKSCIYQRQDPVDIPQIETRTLKDVLGLPWGFEIYSLLTRWNPLNIRRPLPRPATGYKVLVVGLGPAGFTLAHHLMNDGHFVAAVDGLKIEPLPPEIGGVTLDGTRRAFEPIRDVATLVEGLDDRVMAGFGGVAEYGITVRWDKNFLKIVRLLLERRASFSMYGGVRFGGTITIDGAFDLGFDHVALCAGAGRPTVIPMKNGLAPGVRQASDFLMALQLTGAAKTDSIANLTVRLPVVVIGGGLTAIDTATESLAYYPLQVEKFLSRYETLVAERGEEAVRAQWTPPEREVAVEFIEHARAIRAEREAARREGRAPRLANLIDGWGGVTIAYRRRLVDSPSYTLNHEEVAKAMEEGIRFAELLTPVEVDVDVFGQAAALRLTRHSVTEVGGHRPDPNQGPGEEVVLPARTILVAAGTQPNTVLGREDPENIVLDGRYFRALDEEGNPATPERVVKPAAVRVLTHLRPDGRAVSFFGDLHPSFAGNVVKAMGGATLGYPVISRMLARLAPSAPRAGRADGAARLRAARAGARDRPADAEHRRGRRAGADRGARLQARPVLSAAELRAPGAAGRWHDPGDGGAGADRRRDRHGRGPAVDDRARDGRLLRPLRAVEAGRAGDPDGPDRHADRDAVGRDRVAGRRRARQCGAVLDRRGVPRARLAGALFRRLQARAGPLQGRRDRARRRLRRVVLRRGAGLCAGPAAGPRLCRQHRRGDRGLWPGRAWGRSRSRSRRSTASSRSAPTA